MHRFTLTVTLAFVPALCAAEPDFRREVQAILSRAGCNQGACHGNANGKGGFKLSLRCEDADLDHAALTRDAHGRRVDSFHPADSLILQKATGQVSHEGGRRFALDSAEYAMLRDWIAAGCPDRKSPPLAKIVVAPTEQVLVEPADRVQLKVEATYTDGTTRDVTRLAVFEPTAPGFVAVGGDGVATREAFGEVAVQVRYLHGQGAVRLAFVPARPDFRWPDVPERNLVDTHAFAKLKALRMAPSPVCDDATFVRRVYLDALGILPNVTETMAFLDDPRGDKRERLVDALLQRPEFADNWALKWSDLLRNEEKALDPKGVRVFHAWIRDQIAAGVPLNEFARAVVAGRGSTYEEPAANFYRAVREPYARAEAAAQVFLGVRMACAKCHNHPFDRWTQNDYHQWAALFARVRYRVVANDRNDKFDSHEFAGEQVVWQDRTAELPHPRTGRPTPPRFLGTATDVPADADRLLALADWLADPANPYFARAQANRIWFHLFGRGLVEPNDDFRAANPPANPALLDALAKEFVASKFDLRHLTRLILTSTTYQLSTAPNDTNRNDEANFARALVRPLAAEPLLDALSRVLEVPMKFDGHPSGTRAGQLPGVVVARMGRKSDAAARFLKTFGKPDRLISCECERSDDTTLVQAFQLLTGDVLHDLLARRDNRLGRLIDAGQSDAEIVEEFYLAALSRRPSASESAHCTAMLAKAKDRRAALEDIVWGLVNAKEFLLRR